ncbi:DsbA family oxidoreductase [Salinimicrobium xinjiangense]|uniref:DsbA family oxidoreductase n=1 Tax=Salinimicrobium xinjiangense TaxID=438596 RepID=UPI00041021E1|nr:DsbA family oxidoreductase [Salinimicrobium xinjiangense]
MITVDIWSDVRCPFCYIGKRHLEQALEKFENKDEVKVEWHSYQLDPNLETRPEISTIDYFVTAKNVSEEQAREMIAGAQKMGNDSGLEWDLENTVLANSFRAHQVIQLAKEKGLGNEIEEAFFKAYFSEGKNIDDEETMVETAESIGLASEEVREALKNESYSYAVKQDEMQARNIGVRGVPFFVFNNKYAVSGAQPSTAFLEVLQKVKQEQTT